MSEVEKAVNVTAPLDTVMKDGRMESVLWRLRTLGGSAHTREGFIIGNRER